MAHAPTPGNEQAIERLNKYWADGEGAAKINWGVPGDFARCEAELGKFIHDPEVVKGHCANLHKRATGAWPGHAPGAEQAAAHAKHVAALAKERNKGK
ncbi:hypothetical protein [Mycobacterium sp. 1465703.0]|uniref:hypothetical protein n=1 Tax=Mycobacterium sp. 1465703.0 TaxID=1834078 RepID=UPI00080066F0|nr:hypothetical protein [Mycobacterium sp. 1465703.0]OBI95558.1 hypothetical protein A5625_08050 [Mycobacterium sp. 1465703.0]